MGISHSEGQGYGMLLAVAADDRPTFDLLWGWTRAQLMLRNDGSSRGNGGLTHSR